MRYDKLIQRMEVWENILSLLRTLKPRGLYRLTTRIPPLPQYDSWFIIKPKQYLLAELVFHVVCANQPRSLAILNYTYSYLMNCNIEPITREDLVSPEYLHAVYKGPMYDKILKGKTK